MGVSKTPAADVTKLVRRCGEKIRRIKSEKYKEEKEEGKEGKKRIE